LIEEPAPAAVQSTKPERPVAVPKPKPLPRVRKLQPPVKPQVSPPTEERPAAPKAEAPTNTNVPVLTGPPGAAAGDAGAVPSGGAVTPRNTQPDSGAQAGPYNPPHGNMYASSGARAIVRPMPQIPDDLRGEAFNLTALARFHIAPDGSAKVELAKPTPNPRLNQILLDSLKQWRFIPAIKNGKPTASTEEIVVRIEVK
jgi:protein TonB